MFEQARHSTLNCSERYDPFANALNSALRVYISDARHFLDDKGAVAPLRAAKVCRASDAHT
jgi:hypothetical protein